MPWYAIEAPGAQSGVASSRLRPVAARTKGQRAGLACKASKPVIDGVVIGKSAFRGTPTQDVSAFAEGRIKFGSQQILVRLEGFNLLNHANVGQASHAVDAETSPLREPEHYQYAFDMPAIIRLPFTNCMSVTVCVRGFWRAVGFV